MFHFLSPSPAHSWIERRFKTLIKKERKTKKSHEGSDYNSYCSLKQNDRMKLQMFLFFFRDVIKYSDEQGHDVV